MEKSIWDLEKELLKANNINEVDMITREMSNEQLRNIVKLLIDRLAPVNVKLNRILNDAK